MAEKVHGSAVGITQLDNGYWEKHDKYNAESLSQPLVLLLPLKGDGAEEF